VKTTWNFGNAVLLKRPYLTEAMIQKVIAAPGAREVQSDGRIRLRARLEELDNRALRVVLLEDGDMRAGAFRPTCRCPA
jgi:hypothetical protein